MANDQLSEHFSRRELACKCGCGLCNVAPELLRLLETIRALLNTPIYVNSGCRCESHNKAVGGVSTSKHLTGQAADIHTILEPITMYSRIVTAYEAGQLEDLGGVGLYSWGVHVDTAKAADGHLRKWVNRG